MTAECHNLAEDQFGTRMAYADAEVPWHRLGTPMTPDMQTAELMLAAARANQEVRITKVIACDPEGRPLMNTVVKVGVNEETGEEYTYTDLEYVYIEDSRATVACDVWGDGSFSGLSTVGTRYVPTQNAEVLHRALAIIEAAPDAAIVDTVGVMDEGRQFFATIRLADLNLMLPNGAVDRMARYLNVRTSHDGKTPISYYPGDIRQVCRNTVNAAYKGALLKYTARHTKNSVADFHSDEMLEEARRALNLTIARADDLQKIASDMAVIDVTPSMVDRFLADVFDVKDDATDRVKENDRKRSGLIRSLYQNDRNAATFGENGWSLYNATVEYLDHFRDGSDLEKARTSFDLGSWVNKTKTKAQERVLAFAN